MKPDKLEHCYAEIGQYRQNLRNYILLGYYELTLLTHKYRKNTPF